MYLYPSIGLGAFMTIFVGFLKLEVGVGTAVFLGLLLALLTYRSRRGSYSGSVADGIDLWAAGALCSLPAIVPSGPVLAMGAVVLAWHLLSLRLRHASTPFRPAPSLAVITVASVAIVVSTGSPYVGLVAEAVLQTALLHLLLNAPVPTPTRRYVVIPALRSGALCLAAGVGLGLASTYDLVLPATSPTCTNHRPTLETEHDDLARRYSAEIDSPRQIGRFNAGEYVRYRWVLRNDGLLETIYNVLEGRCIR